MHISNVEAKLMEQDLMTIINDFVKVDNLFINEITLNDYVDIRGTFKTFFNLNFQIRAELVEAKGKLIKLTIKNVKVNRIGIFSFIRNKALKIALKKLALEGINYTGKEIVLELDKLLKKVPYVSFDVTRIEVLTGYLVAAVEDINISVSELLKGNEKNTAEKIDTGAEESDGMKDLNDSSKKDNKVIFVEEKLDDTIIVIESSEEDTDEEDEAIEKAKDYYTDIRSALENKIPDKYEKYSDYALLVPDILALVIRLFKDRKVPLKTKIVLGVCISYITMPFDLIHDKVPFIGKLDDLGVAVFALTRIIEDVPKEIILANWEGENSIIEIMENVIIYLNKFTSGGKIDKVYSFIDDIITI